MARPGYDRPRSKSLTPADRRAANADAGQESVFNQIGVGVGNPLYSTALHIQKQHITNVMVDRLQTSQFGPTLQLRKARGDLDEPLTVADEDYCGLIAGYG